jgi:hypothetical protein
MTKLTIWAALCVASAAWAPVSAMAQAQPRPGPTAIRTYVSGLGNDGNTAASCPRPKPCRTLAAAYGVTQKGGEIIALDPGEYGPITITGPVSIFGNIDALIGVVSKGTGVTINAGATDKVIIRNFIVSGAGATDTKGIELKSGQLTLLHSTLKQLTMGLAVSNSKADLVYTDILDNDTGIATVGTGVDTNASFPWTGPTQVRIAWGSAIDNTKAYVMHDPGTGTGGNKVTILEFLTSNTVAAYSTNVTGNGTLVSGTGASCGGTNCQSLGYYSGYTNPK